MVCGHVVCWDLFAVQGSLAALDSPGVSAVWFMLFRLRDPEVPQNREKKCLIRSLYFYVFL